MVNLIWIILLLPLGGALLNVVVGRHLSRPVVGWLASGAVGLAFVVTLVMVGLLLGLPPERRSFTTPVLYTWAAAGDFAVPVQLLVDPLSMLMVLVVTGVGFLIHVYSVGYMAEDSGIRRYFVYLNLFIFSMLLLVLGNNFLLLYIGWELVGLCSYLLISFWYTIPANAAAGAKAFVVNRVGDFALALGIFLIWTTFGSLVYRDVFAAADGVAATTLTLVTLLLFLGATAKSAQFPLHVWLPDAMAGPTPVSALIHAATMVTAGVYLIARTHVLFAAAPMTSTVVAWVGALTALLGASIALVQTDIKRVLAYSTISQLGYMFLAVGLGAYSAGLFHLSTQAVFKALLFLAAGSVMHAVEHGAHAVGEHVDSQDMRLMGGLWGRTPRTGWAFLAGAAALAGLPLTSGFVSKDEILVGAVLTGRMLLYGVGLLTALLTALYAFRQFFLVFARAPRSQAAGHAHESPAVMTLPLMILAVLALGAGLVFGLPAENGALHRWLEPVFADVGGSAGAAEGSSLALVLFGVSSVIALAGAGLAYIAYVRRTIQPAAVAARVPFVYTVLWHKYYVDELYAALFVRPFSRLANFLAAFVDVLIIDGAVSGIAVLFRSLSGGLRRWQTGYVRSYALMMVFGALVVLAYLVWMR